MKQNGAVIIADVTAEVGRLMSILSRNYARADLVSSAEEAERSLLEREKDTDTVVLILEDTAELNQLVERIYGEGIQKKGCWRAHNGCSLHLGRISCKDDELPSHQRGDFGLYVKPIDCNLLTSALGRVFGEARSAA